MTRATRSNLIIATVSITVPRMALCACPPLLLFPTCPYPIRRWLYRLGRPNDTTVASYTPIHAGKKRRYALSDPHPDGFEPPFNAAPRCVVKQALVCTPRPFC